IRGLLKGIRLSMGPSDWIQVQGDSLTVGVDTVEAPSSYIKSSKRPHPRLQAKFGAELCKVCQALDLCCCSSAVGEPCGTKHAVDPIVRTSIGTGVVAVTIASVVACSCASLRSSRGLLVSSQVYHP